MKWLVNVVKEFSEIPVSIDSSNPEIIKSGLEEYDNHMRPLVNSLSLERIDLIYLVLYYQYNHYMILIDV